MQVESSILGLAEIGAGRVVVYGDSNCLDSSHMVTNCYWLLKKILDFTNSNIRDPVLFSDSVKTKLPLNVDDNQLPSRRSDVNFSTYSAVVDKELICQRDSRFEVWGTKGYGIQLMGRNRKLPGYPTIRLDSDLNISVEVSNETPKKNEGYISGVTSRHKSRKNVDFLGFLNHDEVCV